MKTRIYAILLMCLPLFCVGCISETIDVSTKSPYNEIIGQTFKTKATCKLSKSDLTEYPIADNIAIRENGKLKNLTGIIPGIEGIDYIKDGNFFKVIKVIHRDTFEMSYLKIIGYFPTLNKNVDVGYLFNTRLGEPIKINDKYLESVEDRTPATDKK